MSSKHVPGVTAPSRNEQLLHLSLKLQGNKHFAACRGKFGRELWRTVDELIGKAPNPSQFTRGWRDYAGSVAAMGNLLAQYKRNGWKDAYRVLDLALKVHGYMFPVDLIPIEETVPVTAIMLRPKLTLLVAQWLVYQEWSDLENFITGKKEVSDRTRRLFAELPNLQKRLESVHPSDRVSFIQALMSAYEARVAEYEIQVAGHFPTNLELRLMFGQGNHTGGIFIHADAEPFVYLVKGKQDEVLQHFGHRNNEVATWQFAMPRTDEILFLGLHPESEHSYWQQCFPSFASRGLSHEHGTIILPHNLFRHRYQLPNGNEEGITVYDRPERIGSKTVESPHLIFGPIPREYNRVLFKNGH